MLIGISGRKQSGKSTLASILQKKLNSNWEQKQFADKLKDMICVLLGCTREQLEDNEFKEAPLGEEWDLMLANGLPGIMETPADTFNTLTKEQQTWFTRIHTTPRKLLQTLGTDWGRQIVHPNIWTNATMADYKGKKIHYGKAVLHYDGKAVYMPGTKYIDLNNFPEGYVTAPQLDYDWIIPPYSHYPKKLHNTRVSNENFRWESEEPILPNWIITDVRFPNEVKVIQDRGGIVIRLEREIIQYDRTCLKCYTGFNIDEESIESTMLTQDFLNKFKCPKCGSTNNNAAVYREKDLHPSETALDNYERFDGVFENKVEEGLGVLEALAMYIIDSYKLK